MDVLKEVFRKDVHPAMGCTEPGAIALACSKAVAVAREHGHANPGSENDIDAIHVVVSPGVFKNALGVTVPNTGGEKAVK
jgi:L-cysteine desulfidase